MTDLLFSCRPPSIDGNSRDKVTGLAVRGKPSMYTGQLMGDSE